MYRRRVALEWRAAVAVTIAAAVGLLLALLPVDGMWWLCVFGATVLVCAIAVVAAFRYPVESPPALPKRTSYNDATAATKRVHRGQPVDPPELQAAAIGQARRGLRIAHLNFGWFPVLGATWAARISEDGFFGGFGYVGLGFMLFGIAGLVWSGVTQRRLDRLEEASTAGAIPQPEELT